MAWGKGAERGSRYAIFLLLHQSGVLSRVKPRRGSRQLSSEDLVGIPLSLSLQIELPTRSPQVLQAHIGLPSG